MTSISRASRSTSPARPSDTCQCSRGVADHCLEQFTNNVVVDRVFATLAASCDIALLIAAAHQPYGRHRTTVFPLLGHRCAELLTQHVFTP